MKKLYFPVVKVQHLLVRKTLTYYSYLTVGRMQPYSMLTFYSRSLA